MRFALPVLACASVVCLEVSSARGHEPGPQATAQIVAREDALRLGAAGGPGVAIAAAPGAAARDARDAATALLRPATVAVYGGYRAGALGPGPELGVTVSQDLALRDVGAARSGTADALANVVSSDRVRARIDAAARAGLAWAATLEAKEVVRLRRAAEDQAATIVRTAEARVRSGTGMPYELAIVKGDAAAAHAAVLDAEGVLVEMLAELRFALGLDAAAAVDVSGDLYSTDDRPIDEAFVLRYAVSTNPTVVYAEARAALARQETRLTHATLGPTLTLGASYVREGTGDHVFTGFVGVPIPFLDPAAFDAARARAFERTAEAQIARVRAEASRDLRVALHDREHWREVREALRTGALVPTREGLRLARAAYETGTQDVSVVLLARQRVIAVEEQLAHVAAEVQRADVRFGRAAGTLMRGEAR